MQDTITQGRFTGVGVGPGDPELLTLKALRTIQNADVVSYICNQQGQSQAKTIAALAFETISKPQQSLGITMPMSEDRTQANSAYDSGAKEIVQALNQGLDVVFLCEGDPLFFGSFAYLLERLQALGVACDIVPGISSVHAASAALQSPLTLLKESFCVMSGRHSDEELLRALESHDSVVIMKAGRARQKILKALEASGRMADGQYIEYIGRDQQLIETDLHKLAREPGPYFSIFVINRSQRNSQ